MIGYANFPLEFCQLTPALSSVNGPFALPSGLRKKFAAQVQMLNMEEDAKTMDQDLTLFSFSIVTGDGVVNDEALRILQEEKREVVVLCAHGKSGAGKSTFLEKVIEETGSLARFRDTDEIEETERLGITFWKGDFFQDKNKALILLNSYEPLFDLSSSNRPTNRNIFILSYFLSSVYIWMKEGSIDLNSLSFLKDADHFRAHDSEEVARHAPKFIWAARDGPRGWPIGDATKNFNDKLRFKDGTQSRGSLTGVTDNALMKSQNQLFNDFFPKNPIGRRRCFNTLSVDEDDDSDNEAEQSITSFLEYLKSECGDPKKINDFPLNGTTFAELAKHFLECLKDDKICITMATNVIVKKRVLGDAIENFVTKMEPVHAMMPLSERKLEKFMRDARKEAEELIRQASGGERQMNYILAAFGIQVEQVQRDINKSNIEKSQKRCVQEFIQFKELKDKAQNGFFENSQELRNEAQPMFENYERVYDEILGPCKHSVLEKYKKEVNMSMTVWNRDGKAFATSLYTD